MLAKISSVLAIFSYALAKMLSVVAIFLSTSIGKNIICVGGKFCILFLSTLAKI